MDEFLIAREPAGPADKVHGADLRLVLGALGRLLAQMGSSGDPAATDGLADRLPDSWEDDAYIYFEAMLPNVRDRDLDVCVHDGKVVIRIEKK